MSLSVGGEKLGDLGIYFVAVVGTCFLCHTDTTVRLYGCDISNPATNVQEAIQAVYFGYLCAVKEQNGAAMSLGRTSTFLDIYAERDLKNGTFTEEQIQEFIDHFIMKLRLIKFARTPEYNQIFAGDPVWVTESLAG